MPATPPTTQDIVAMVAKLSDKHVLKRMPAQYVAGFAQAVVNVYDSSKIGEILQHKFYIPDDANFTEDAYLQSASELTVASYIRGRGVSDFDAEKKVNPLNTKDVDVYYRVGSTRVCLEVKCPFEESLSGLPWTVFTAGHTPGGPERVREFLNSVNLQYPDSLSRRKEPRDEAERRARRCS